MSQIGFSQKVKRGESKVEVDFAKRSLLFAITDSFSFFLFSFSFLFLSSSYLLIFLSFSSSSFFLFFLSLSLFHLHSVALNNSFPSFTHLNENINILRLYFFEIPFIHSHVETKRQKRTIY